MWCFQTKSLLANTTQGGPTPLRKYGGESQLLKSELTKFPQNTPPLNNDVVAYKDKLVQMCKIFDRLGKFACNFKNMLPGPRPSLRPSRRRANSTPKCAWEHWQFLTRAALAAHPWLRLKGRLLTPG